MSREKLSLSFYKEHYSIKDLESFSGIKAHTIRMWEKRHDLLHPKRTDSNIRRYDQEAFKRLMNVAFLKKNGFKISELCHLQDDELSRLVEKHSKNPDDAKNRFIQQLKIAMLDFDQQEFEQIYGQLTKKFSQREIFLDVFVPFLKSIGLLWQTHSINPAHEHFVSHWMRKKLLAQIDKAQEQKKTTSGKTYVMFLPEEEIHDLGLLFIYNQLMIEGYQCIYLGYSLPVKYLKDLAEKHKDLYFISYFSTHPQNPKKFLKEFHTEIGKHYSCHLWLLGQKTKDIQQSDLPNYCQVYDNIPQILNVI